MIVLSVGMPRAGSGWHYNLIQGLMKTTGAVDAHEIRERYGLQRILTEVNSNVGVLSIRRLGLLTMPALMGNSFVIKAHAGPTRTSRLLKYLGLLRISYIYRDPRDAMLSAFEYGQRALAKGHPNAFSHLTDFQESLDFILRYVRIWEKWMRERDVLVTRYEDLLGDYDTEAARLTDFLKLDGTRPEVRTVIEVYRPGAAEPQQGLHFHKGRVGRFREVYSEQEQMVLAGHLGAILPRMGYEV